MCFGLNDQYLDNSCLIQEWILEFVKAVFPRTGSRNMSSKAPLEQNGDGGNGAKSNKCEKEWTVLEILSACELLRVWVNRYSMETRAQVPGL